MINNFNSFNLNVTLINIKIEIKKWTLRAIWELKIFDLPDLSWIHTIVTPIGQGALPIASSKYLSCAFL
jgi:hypothetical protein